jgi:hypothetical protein
VASAIIDDTAGVPRGQAKGQIRQGVVVLVRGGAQGGDLVEARIAQYSGGPFTRPLKARPFGRFLTPRYFPVRRPIAKGK